MFGSRSQTRLHPGDALSVPSGDEGLLTVFRKTLQHEQRQIDRAVRARKTCERDHNGPATETCETLPSSLG